MSRGNSIERALMMQALGAEVVLVDQAEGAVAGRVSGRDLALVEERARQLVIERGAFRADQFSLATNALAHERHTGPEIWVQSGGSVDVFLDFAGTGGTFAGVTRALRARKPALRAYVVEPAGAAVLGRQPVTQPNHQIQGGGYGIPDLKMIDRSLVTDYLQVADGAAIDATRALAREEGIFGGVSAGANLAAALELLAGPEAGATIAFVVPDSGLKYLSTELYATPDL
jgi:cysteine synthase A